MIMAYVILLRHNYILPSPLHFPWFLLSSVFIEWIVHIYRLQYSWSVLVYSYLSWILRWARWSARGDRAPSEMRDYRSRWWVLWWVWAWVTGVWVAYILDTWLAGERGVWWCWFLGSLWSIGVQSRELLQFSWSYFVIVSEYIVLDNSIFSPRRMRSDRSHTLWVSQPWYVHRARHM